MRLHLYGLATIAIAVALVCGVKAAQQANPAQVALRAAMDTEVVDGDLAAAIKQYQAIVEKYGKADRVTAATALVRLGGCYQKLGDSQARAAYSRVLRDFADVKDAAAAARSQLSELDARSRTPVRGGLALRRIYDGPGLDWCNGLSSDARHLSHVDWLTGNIAIAELTSGTVRPVTTTGSINQRNGQFGECSVFSPDDKQLAYYWYADDHSELRIAGLDGSKPRTLFRTEEYLRPLDWSPDGRSILIVVSARAGHQQLVLLSAGDGAARVLETPQDHSLKGLFSPDGRYVAYSGGAAAAPEKSDIFIMGVDGSSPTGIVRHPADDGLLGWASDGSGIYFWSDRTGSGDVWRAGIENGRPSGAAALIKSGVGSTVPVRVLRDSLFYTSRSQLSEIRIASFEGSSGRLRVPFSPAKLYASTSDSAPEWSPDGRFLAYRSIPGGSDLWANPPSIISILNVETREERALRLDVAVLDPVDGPHWSPDGKSLIVIGKQNTPLAGVYRVDVATGATTPLVNVPRGQWLLYTAWSRDGLSIFYTIGSPTRIVRRDIATGKETDLVRIATSPAGVPRLAVSPDGRTLAYVAREPSNRMVRAINLVSTDGGDSRAIYRTGENEGIGGLAWAADGRYLFFRKSLIVTAQPNRPPTSEFWRIARDGSQPQRLDMDVSGQSGQISFSPDGQRLAVTMGEIKTELWVLENLSKAVKGS